MDSQEYLYFARFLPAFRNFANIIMMVSPFFSFLRYCKVSRGFAIQVSRGFASAKVTVFARVRSLPANDLYIFLAYSFSSNLHCGKDVKFATSD